MDPIDSVKAELVELEAKGLFRRPHEIDGPQGPVIRLDGRRVINFSSNDYLGLAAHLALREAIKSTVDAVGVGASASRLISGTTAAHRLLEVTVASWLGVERALAFNSGYQANVGVISALVGPDDVVFSDALNHASIIDGCRLSRARVVVYPHGDLATLTRLVDHHQGGRRLIVSESLFSMDGDIVDLAGLRQLAKKSGCLLLIDDAHAVGAVGAEGRGLAVAADLVVGTLGKALGSFGAFVAGNGALIELIFQKARSFVFSTALPAAVAAASTAAISLARGAEGEARRQRLATNVERFVNGLRARSIESSSRSHIQPVVLGEAAAAMKLSSELLESGLFVQGIRPPTVPRGTSRLRITLTSEHSFEQLDSLLAKLNPS